MFYVVLLNRSCILLKDTSELAVFMDWDQVQWRPHYGIIWPQWAKEEGMCFAEPLHQFTAGAADGLIAQHWRWDWIRTPGNRIWSLSPMTVFGRFTGSHECNCSLLIPQNDSSIRLAACFVRRPQRGSFRKEESPLKHSPQVQTPCIYCNTILLGFEESISWGDLYH